MIHAELLEIVRCPETKQKLKEAEATLIEKLNAQIDKGELKQRDGQVLAAKLDGGLLREDGKLLFPIRNDVPVLLMHEAIEV